MVLQYELPFKNVVDMMNFSVDDPDLKLYLSLYLIAEHDELPLESHGIEVFAAAAPAPHHLHPHPNSVFHELEVGASSDVA